MGTRIDAAAVARSGGSYQAAADALGTVGGRIRGYTAEPGDFGRNYRTEGQAYGSALSGLARAVDAWRDGARACGGGLQTSATAHVRTDAAGAVGISRG
ncbi:hypothetical protein GCM10027289_11040 [Tsukamurella serpentis]